MNRRRSFCTATSRAGRRGIALPGLRPSRRPGLFRRERDLVCRLRLPGAPLRCPLVCRRQIGLVCPKTPTLAVHGVEIRRAPSMLHRWITPGPLYLPGPPQKAPEQDVQLWKLRMRIGGQNFWVCHLFYGYYDRFLTTHPDWFAQGYAGQPPQMCYTHPGFIRQVVQDARDYFDGKGIKSGATAVGDVFGLVPMDNMELVQMPPLPGRVEQRGGEEPTVQQRKGERLRLWFREQGGPRSPQDPPGQADRGLGLLRLCLLPGQGARGAERRRAVVPAHAELVVPVDGGQRPEGAPPVARARPGSAALPVAVLLFPGAERQFGGLPLFPRVLRPHGRAADEALPRREDRQGSSWSTPANAARAT